MELEKDIVEIIKKSKVIAVVGASRNPEKAAHLIPKYLKEHGYKIIPVNPSGEKILGEQSYKKLSDIKTKVDIVNIFRPSEETPEIVKEAVTLKPKLIWLQLEIMNNKAKEIAEKSNIKFVMNRCLKVEHSKIFWE